MMTQITVQQAPWVSEILAKDDFIGMRIASALRCYGFASKVCRFYAVNSSAVLMTLGDGALLCGDAPDVEELESFLRFANLRTLQANKTMLYHWNPVPRLLMRHTGAAEILCSAPVEMQPDLWALAHSGLFENLSPDAWYADTCLRVNHGEAAVFAIIKEGAPVASAGLYAIGEKSAYLTAVATKKEQRGNGYASTLVSTLCAMQQNRTIYLLCAQILRAAWLYTGAAAM